MKLQSLKSSEMLEDEYQDINQPEKVEEVVNSKMRRLSLRVESAQLSLRD